MDFLCTSLSILGVRKDEMLRFFFCFDMFCCCLRETTIRDSKRKGRLDQSQWEDGAVIHQDGRDEGGDGWGEDENLA